MAEATDRNPTDRGKAGAKRRLLTGGKGRPTPLILSDASLTDMKKLPELLDAAVARPVARENPDLATE
ncbi:MAG: hypothetical protein ACR2PL_13110 [Dehalococcoidia bacterium]